MLDTVLATVRVDGSAEADGRQGGVTRQGQPVSDDALETGASRIPPGSEHDDAIKTRSSGIPSERAGQPETALAAGEERPSDNAPPAKIEKKNSSKILSPMLQSVSLKNF